MIRRSTRGLLILCLLIGLFMLSALPAFAGSASVSGTLTPGAPTMPVVMITPPDCAGQGITQVLYHAIAFSVDTAGTYTLDLNIGSGDISLYLMTAAFNPAAGFPTCLAADNADPISVSYGLAANTTYIAVPFDDTFAQAGGSYTLTISGPGNVYFDGVARPGSGQTIDDGRLNKYDLAAPYAVYCTSNGVEVWAIDSAGHGSLAFTTAEAHEAGAANVLVNSGMGISLYQLASGEMQLVGAPDAEGKVYSVLFNAFPCSLIHTTLQ